MQSPSKNQFERARTIIQSLVHGIDPETGNELPKDSVVNRIEVNRALTTGVFALDQMMARLTRRAQLPGNVGRSWTKDEEDTLTADFKCGDSVADIAARHGRTVRAIEARLEKLGLITAAQRTTDNSFVANPSTNRDDK